MQQQYDFGTVEHGLSVVPAGTADFDPFAHEKARRAIAEEFVAAEPDWVERARFSLAKKGHTVQLKPSTQVFLQRYLAIGGSFDANL